MRRFAYLILLLLLAAPAALGQVPGTISYQGVLTDTAGTPVADGTYAFTFRLYDAGGAATPIWEEEQSVAVIGGVYHVVLGAVRPLAVAFDRPFWLGVTVGDDAEMAPRLAFTAAPYSLRARALDDGAIRAGDNVTLTRDGDALVISAAPPEPADSAITGANIAAGQLVRSLNGLTDNIVLRGAGGATVTTQGDTLVLTAAGGGTGIQGLQNTDNTLAITEPNGPTATINLRGGGIGTEQLADAAVTALKIGNAQVVKGITVAGTALRDEVTIVAGENVSVAADEATRTVTISAAESTSGLITTDGDTLVLRVNGSPGLRIVPGTFTYAPEPALPPATFLGTNSIGGSEVNSIASGIAGATISGGGSYGEVSTNPNSVTGSFGTVGGGQGNTAGFGATVGGGAQNRAEGGGATIGGGEINQATATLSTIGGGSFNEATGTSSTVGGGQQNKAEGGGATISGGHFNEASVEAAVGGGGYNVASGSWSTIAGGSDNSASDDYAAILGGEDNEAAGEHAIIGGGLNNQASGTYAAVVGGLFNHARADNAAIGGGDGNVASGPYSTIGGGNTNRADGGDATVGGGSQNVASGKAATVPGGMGNKASGRFSLAAGRLAEASHNATFVWADTTGDAFVSTDVNQFLIRAAGGVGINTNSPAGLLHVQGTGEDQVALYGDDSVPLLHFRNINSQRDWVLRHDELRFHIQNEVAPGNERLTIEAGGNVGIGTTDPTVRLEVNGDVRANNVSTSSDVRFKEDVAPIEDALETIRRLRGVSFMWRRADYPERRFAQGRQLGFLAQEVREVVPGIVSKDAEGFYAVSYDQLVPLLVEAFKAQQRQLEALQRQLEAHAITEEMP